MINSGTTDDTLTYNVWGGVTSETNPVNGDRDKAFGYQWDATTSMFYVDWRWYDPAGIHWVTPDPLGLTAGSNPNRYGGNSPTNATDPSGLVEADMDVKHVFKEKDWSRGQVLLNLSAKIEGGNLTIKVLEGKGFRKAVNPSDWPFRAVVAGTFDKNSGRNVTFKDTDSLQVEVRWTKNVVVHQVQPLGYRVVKEDVGHDSNVVPPKKGFGDPRKQGADWVFGVDKKTKMQFATWSPKEKVPQGATHLDVIIVYTDAKYGTPAEPFGGDFPIIVGSFSADLKNGKWTIKANPKDVFKPREKEPDPKEYAKIDKDTRDKLLEKTGYELSPRPKGLAKAKTKAEAKKAIDDALGQLANKEINSKSDTGSDIVKRK
jgi:RHS repeat-associated protein